MIWLASSRDGRSEANQIIQDGLKAEGTLKGEGRAFNVRETLQLTREEYRYARNWKAAHLLAVGSHDNGHGMPKGDYHIESVFETDRKRVGEGKREAVRDSLGGHGTDKKQKNNR